MSKSLEIKVIISNSTEKIIKENDILKVYINVSPEKGKANKRTLELIARYLGLKKSQLSIIKGQTCRNKVISIT